MHYYDTQNLATILWVILVFSFFLSFKPQIFSPKVLIFPFDLDSCIFLFVTQHSTPNVSFEGTLTGFVDCVHGLVFKRTQQKNSGGASSPFQSAKGRGPISETFRTLLSKRQWVMFRNMIIPKDAQPSFSRSCVHQFLHSLNTKLLPLLRILTCSVLVFLCCI